MLQLCVPKYMLKVGTFMSKWIYNRIHSNIIFCLSEVGLQCQQAKLGFSDFPIPTGRSKGIPRHDEINNLQYDLGLSQGLLQVGHPRKPRREAPSRFLNHLSWLLSTWRISGFTLSSSMSAAEPTLLYLHPYFFANYAHFITIGEKLGNTSINPHVHHMLHLPITHEQITKHE